MVIWHIRFLLAILFPPILSAGTIVVKTKVLYKSQNYNKKMFDLHVYNLKRNVSGIY